MTQKELLAISPAAEHRLWLQYKTTGCSKAQTLLVRKYMPLTRKLARKVFIWVSSYIEFCDVLGYAHMELLNCMTRFDLQRGTRFSTYLCHRLPAIVKNYVARESGASIETLRQVAAMNQYIQDYRTDYGYKPDVDTIAKGLGVSRNSVYNYTVLDRSTRECVLLDNHVLGYHDIMLEKVRYRQLLDEITLWRPDENPLTEREHLIASLRVLEDMSFDEIGQHLGITRQRVHQIWHRRLLPLLQARVNTLKTRRAA